MKIYVAGPYSGKTDKEIEENVNRAIEVSIELIAKGHSPFVPHLLHFIHTHSKDGHFDYETWMNIGRDFLLSCDALYYVAPSPGADRELQTAKDMGMTLFNCMNEVPDAKKKNEKTDEVKKEVVSA